MELTATTMQRNYHLVAEPNVPQQVQSSTGMQTLPHHAQYLPKLSADVGEQPQHQPAELKIPIPDLSRTYVKVISAGPSEDVTKTFVTSPYQMTAEAFFLWPESETQRPGTWGQEPWDPTLGMASLMAPLENPMLDMRSFSITGPNAGSSHSAVQIKPHDNLIGVSAPGAKGLAMMPWHVSPGRQQPMPYEDTQVFMVGGHGAVPNTSVGSSAPGAFGDMRGDRRTKKMIWSNNRSDVCVVVLATDEVREPMTSMWSDSLRLEIVETGKVTLDIQALVHETKAPVVRIKSALEAGNRNFGRLVKSLRNGYGYAIAQPNIVGCPRARLLFAPFNKDLLCVVCKTPPVFPTPKPPTSQPCLQKAAKSAVIPQQPQPQPCTQPQGSYPPQDTMECMQYDPHSFGHLGQAIASAPVHAISLPHLQLWQEAYTQESLQQPPAHQDQELASPDTQRKLNARWIDTGPANYVADLSSSMDIDSGFTGADAIGWSSGSDLGSGGGTMNGNGISAMPNTSADFVANEDCDWMKLVNWEGNEDCRCGSKEDLDLVKHEYWESNEDVYS